MILAISLPSFRAVSTKMLQAATLFNMGWVLVSLGDGKFRCRASQGNGLTPVLSTIGSTALTIGINPTEWSFELDGLNAFRISFSLSNPPAPALSTPGPDLILIGAS